MRVLFISGSYPPLKCGVGDYLQRLAQALSKSPDMQVGILTSSDSTLGSQDSKPMIFPIIKSWGIVSILKIARFIWNWKPDVVHIQFPTQGYFKSPGTLRLLTISLLPAISFILGRKVVQTWHEYESHNIKSLIYFVLRAVSPSRIIVVRPDFYDQLPPLLRLLFKYKSIEHIRNASSIPRLPFSKRQIEDLRAKYLGSFKRLLLFFGFIYPHKGAELLFEIANPASDRIIFAGGFDQDSDYINCLKTQAASDAWSGKVDLLGFTPTEEISALLSIADAVVLPFRNEGGGIWNSSLHAAISHNVFVLTTSTTQSGYDEKLNIHYSPPDDIKSMKLALDQYAGTKREESKHTLESDWEEIAGEHRNLYRRMLKQQERA
jgi:glycosyltransferase involved in cell wall biosynthesis